MARKAHRVHASARDTFGSMLRLLLVFLPLAASSNTNTSITATNATANGLKLSQVEGKVRLDFFLHIMLLTHS